MTSAGILHTIEVKGKVHDPEACISESDSKELERDKMA